MMNVLSAASLSTNGYRTGPSGPSGMLGSSTTTTTTTTTNGSTRKRKRQTAVVSYSEIKEVDVHGRTRDVIVLDDTPPPSTLSPASTRYGASASVYPPLYSAPVRTRARAAREAESSSVLPALAPPPAKKRKVVAQRIAPAPKKVLSSYSAKSEDTPKPAPPCDDKEGHYIIVPDDLIFNRCKHLQFT